MIKDLYIYIIYSLINLLISMKFFNYKNKDYIINIHRKIDSEKMHSNCTSFM